MDNANDATEMATAVDTAEAIRTGNRSASDVMEDVLERVAAHNDDLNAFVFLAADSARAAAREIDARLARGEDPGPLAGVPFGVKDLEDCRGMPTSHGSLLYKDGEPAASDSLHVQRLRAAGAVPIGKTAAPEFGTLHFTRTPAWGTTRNPWNLEKTPGGSSGGSASAVAAGLLPFATASDGGGSTRIPGSYSGLVGMKPSFGRIPQRHHDDSQTSVPGAMVTSVRDSARYLDAVSGPDPRDKISLPASSIRYEQRIETLDVAGLRVAWSSDLGFAQVDPEVERLTRAAADRLIDSAALDRCEVDLEFTNPIRAWMGVGALTLWLEIDRHQHWPQRADELSPYVRRVLAATEKRPLKTLDGAYRRRWQLESEMAALFQEIDVLLCPTTATPAFAASGPSENELSKHGVPLGGEVPFTMLANLCWNPACSVPAGLNSEGLPVGLQIIGAQHRDDVVLRLARLFEQAQPWPRLAPPL